MSAPVVRAWYGRGTRVVELFRIALDLFHTHNDYVVAEVAPAAEAAIAYAPAVRSLVVQNTTQGSGDAVIRLNGGADIPVRKGATVKFQDFTVNELRHRSSSGTPTLLIIGTRRI